jgi:hypothetical protein
MAPGAGTTRRSRPDRQPTPLARLARWAAGLASLVVLAAGGYLAWAAVGGGQPVPPCSWPLRLHGHATSSQAGLIRC